MSAPRGGKKTKGEFPWRLFPPGSGVTWALGRRVGAGTRWNLWAGQGDAGKGEEARQPESEVQGTPEARLAILAALTCRPRPLLQPLVGFLFLWLSFLRPLPHRISSF